MAGIWQSTPRQPDRHETPCVRTTDARTQTHPRLVTMQYSSGKTLLRPYLLVQIAENEINHVLKQLLAYFKVLHEGWRLDRRQFHFCFVIVAAFPILHISTRLSPFHVLQLHAADLGGAPAGF